MESVYCAVRTATFKQATAALTFISIHSSPPCSNSAVYVALLTESLNKVQTQEAVNLSSSG